MKIKYLFLGLGLLWLGLYFIPSPQVSFEKKYPEKNAITESLMSFKSQDLKSIDYNDKQWNYFSGGCGDRTIFFVHGMGGSYFLWWQQIEALKNNFKVISYELPKNVSSIEEASSGILAILDAEDIDTFNIVGTSMGGYISQQVMYEAPQRVKKIVLGNTFPPNDWIKSSYGIAKFVPYLPSIVIYYARNRNFKKGMIASCSQPELLAAYLLDVPFSKKRFIERYRIVTDDFNEENNESELTQIPKLIIECSNDPLIPLELREQLKIRYPNAKVVNLGDEGHIPSISKPDEYNAALINFFN